MWCRWKEINVMSGRVPTTMTIDSFGDKIFIGIKTKQADQIICINLIHYYCKCCFKYPLWNLDENTFLLRWYKLGTFKFFTIIFKWQEWHSYSNSKHIFKSELKKKNSGSLITNIGPKNAYIHFTNENNDTFLSNRLEALYSKSL